MYGTTLGPEAPFTMYAAVTNAGDGSSAATTLRYYRSTDATITTSDTEVGTDAVGSLAADGASGQSVDLAAPSTMGTYYYGACVDAVSRESDTTDNCSSSVEITMAPPELEFDGGGKLGPGLSTDGLFQMVVVLENVGRGKTAPTTHAVLPLGGHHHHDVGHGDRSQGDRSAAAWRQGHRPFVLAKPSLRPRRLLLRRVLGCGAG